MKFNFLFLFQTLLGAISNWTKLPPPLFSKVVIMLIDALRDDFVFGSKGVKFMPYTTYLVEKGSSHSFVAEAKPPTVTMPRIKVNSLTERIIYRSWFGSFRGLEGLSVVCYLESQF